MKKTLLSIGLMLPILSLTATPNPASSKVCFHKVTMSEKEWHVIEVCGKPITASFDIQPAKSHHYDVYEYTVNEPVCYTTVQSPQVICDKDENVPVRFYFHNDQLHNIEYNGAQVNNLFLTFNQHVVLGDSEKMLLNLWGEPAQKSRKKLTLPNLEERWQYNEGTIIFINGLVTQLVPNVPHSQ